MKKYKIAILDRDGVINKANKNGGYIGKIKDFTWMPGAKKTIKYLKENEYKVVVVSNQSGISRGYFKYRDVIKLHKFMNKELKKYGTFRDSLFFCPHHVDGIIKKYNINCKCRKPKNEHFKKIKKKWKINIKKSFMIGDQKTDMEFAKKSNLKSFLYKEKNLFNYILKKSI